MNARQWESKPRIAALLVGGAIFLWLAWAAWARPLLLPDEGRYIGVAWEMLRSGRWLTPTLDGLPYFHKPPLFYWITASSLWVFGQQEGAARLASMLGATLVQGVRPLANWQAPTPAMSPDPDCQPIPWASA